MVVKVTNPALETGSTTDTYAIKVTASDGLKSASATIDLTVKFNNPPTVTNAASLDLGSSVAGLEFTGTISKSSFNDPENKAFTLVCASAVVYTVGQTATATGITVVKNGDDYDVTGTAPSKTYENAQFKIPCTLSDGSKTKIEYPYFKYTDNLDPTVGD